MIKERNEDNIIIATFENGKYNTITTETLLQIRDLVKRVTEDDALKGIVFTGNGRTYCSGFDLPTFLGFKELKDAVAFFDLAEPVFMEVFMCPKPVIAAINGSAMAGGLIISMAADHRIAKNHPKIQIGMTEIKIGLGLTVVQSALMRYGLDSEKRFRTVMYGGERYSPEASLALGIVDELASEEELLPRAKQIVTSWINNPARAFRLLKYNLRKPVYDQMKHYLATENWQDGLNCMFDPQTRATLELVASMMK